MSDSEINEEEDLFEIEDEGTFKEENADSDIAEIEEDQKETQIEEQPQIVIERGDADPTAATYIFSDEDHTLGNALRFMLIKRPDVEFCGYSIPHPSENFMNLRLQVVEKNSNDVLKAGLKDLASVCDLIDSKFNDALKKFEKNKGKSSR